MAYVIRIQVSASVILDINMRIAHLKIVLESALAMVSATLTAGNVYAKRDMGTLIAQHVFATIIAIPEGNV